MIKVRSYTHQVDIPVKSWTFPAGERGITSDPMYVHSDRDVIEITLEFQGSDDIVDLILLREMYINNRVTLTIPYMPFGRQDRKVNCEDVHALKAFAHLINSLNFSKVVTCDPHSDVIEALFVNCVIQRQWDIAKDIIKEKYDYIIAPDIGAAKKTEQYAKLVGTKMLQCVKKRDPDTGALLRFEILDCPDLNGKRVLVLDDICDGGGTFILLAQDLPETCVADLYVTHGIFSKGLSDLEKYYSTFYCYNVLNTALKAEFTNGVFK